MKIGITCGLGGIRMDDDFLKRKPVMIYKRVAIGAVILGVIFMIGVLLYVCFC